MTQDYYFSNLLTEIQSCEHFVKNISKEEFLEKYEGTVKKEEMEKIFSIFDRLDKSNDGVIDLEATFGGGMPTWWTNMTRTFFTDDPKAAEQNEVEYILDVPDNIEGEKISEDSFKEALESLHSFVTKKCNAIKESNAKQRLEERKAANPDIPDSVLNNILFEIESDTPIKIIDGGYETVSQNEGSCTVRKFNSEGKLTTVIKNYNYDNEDNFGIIISEAFFYSAEGTTRNKKYKGGSTLTTEETVTGEILRDFLKYGKNQLSYTPELSKITVNTGLPNETSFVVSRDDKGKITDISYAEPNQVLKMSDKTKNQLIILLNNDAVLGRNFDLNVSCNEISIEIIKDENIPEKAKSEIDRLSYAGIMPEKDYKAELLESGDYIIEYLSNKSRDFSVDKRKTIYYADGTVLTIEQKGESIYITQNDEVKEYTIEEFKKIMPEEQSFIQTKKVSENRWENYSLKVDDKEFAEKLYKAGDKKYISDTEYSQNIEENTYNVKLQEGKIFVTKNGEEFSIDVSDMTDGGKKFIAECSPEVLFRIASQGIKLILDKIPHGDGDGEYLPEQKAIYIDPEASEVSILQRRIAHEVGHSYYTYLNTVNKELEETFKKESEQYQNEVESIKASVIPAPGDDEWAIMAKQFEELHKFDKYAEEYCNERYCATNVYEFVAEAYCLLVTGEAKSEFTIAKVYPETFELVKKMIEEDSK